MKQFTTEDVIGALSTLDLPNTRNHFTGSGCSYRDGDGPGCIAGHVVHQLDPQLWDIIKDSGNTWITLPMLVRRNFTENADVLIQRLQQQADKRVKEDGAEKVQKNYLDVLRDAGVPIVTTIGVPSELADAE